MTSSDVLALSRFFEKSPSLPDSFESTDADFIVLLHPVESRADVAFAFFAGEPYVVMKGYRFVVEDSRLREFGAALKVELEQVLP